jgi:hypothetical protein
MKLNLNRSAVTVLLCLTLGACGRHDVVDLQKMHRLLPGMTYDQVVAVVGVPGRPFQAGEYVEGALVPKPTETVYIWKNKDGSNMTASFNARGQLNGLGQSGL